MGTKLLMSTAFHPQMDGATEQANHSIGQILRMIINDHQKNWADKCPMVEFALNSSVSATTSCRVTQVISLLTNPHHLTVESTSS